MPLLPRLLLFSPSSLILPVTDEPPPTLATGFGPGEVDGAEPDGVGIFKISASEMLGGVSEPPGEVASELALGEATATGVPLGAGACRSNSAISLNPFAAATA